MTCLVIRYNFGTTEGEISGERLRKRRSAKYLGFLSSLLEAMQCKALTAASGPLAEERVIYLALELDHGNTSREEPTCLTILKHSSTRSRCT